MATLTDKENRALVLFKERLLKSFPGQIDDINLFGSKSRGDASKHSDVDVLVILKSMSWQDKKLIRGIAADIIFNTDVLLSVQVFSREQVNLMKRRRAIFWQAIEHDLHAL